MNKILLLLLPLVLCNCSPHRPDTTALPSPAELVPPAVRAMETVEATGPYGPDYPPPFEIKQGERVDGELRKTSFLNPANGNRPAEAATLVFGNKRVAVRENEQGKMRTDRDNAVTVYVNEVPLCRILLVGSYAGKDGEPVSMNDSKSLEDVTFTVDEAAGVIRWSCDYPLPDGNQTRFSYELKSLGDSQVELSWDIGLTEEQIEKFSEAGANIGGYQIYISMAGDYRKDGLSINGEAVQPKPVDELKANERKHLVNWEGTLTDLSYASEQPLYGFELQSAEGLKGVFREVSQYNRIDAGFMFRGTRPEDSVVIDLGKVNPPDENAPEPIEGHDLWAQDALHLYDPPNRNLFPNSSFEQGLYYWRWMSGGATYEPSEVLRYGIDPEGGRFGQQAMVIRPVQSRSSSLRSFSIPGAKGKTYTLSYYAKAENDTSSLILAPFSSKSGGKFTRAVLFSYKRESLRTEWQRYSHSFESDGAPVSFVILAHNGGKIWLDGIQFEEGDAPTEYVAPPLEGELSTSHPQNNVEFGDPIKAKYTVRGAEGTEGAVTFELKDFYENVIWSHTKKVKAGQVLDLPFDEANIGKGAFFLRAHYEVPDTEPYDLYYRFTVIDSLNGTHATKDLYGALVSSRINRTEEEIALSQRLGFIGSSSYGAGKVREPLTYQIRDKFNITDYTHTLTGMPHLNQEQYRERHPDMKFAMTLGNRPWRTEAEKKSIQLIETYSEEDLQYMEDMAERAAKEAPYVRVWSLGTEEEISIQSLKKNKDFKEYAKLLVAFYKGIKKGNPDAIVLPSGGTSGYGKTRGKDDIEGFLRETQGKVKWDAVAIHPYGSIDGTLGFSDLDESLQMLKDSMAQFGYGDETPIYLNEGGGEPANLWGDGPDWSYYGGQPSYDQGLHEFLNASKMARQYIICLKYWPQVPHFNTWQHDERRIVDYNLTPTSFLLGINTLGHLLGEPEFIGDVRPAQGVRGYAFEDKENGGVVAIWCTIDDVERGFVRGPVMRVRFEGDLPKMVDLMGNERPLKAGPDGTVDIRLTPAPLFFQGKDPQALAKALQEAEVLGAGANVKVSFMPSLDSEITARVENMTSREQAGDLIIDGDKVPFRVAGSQKENIKAAQAPDAQTGKMYSWNTDYQIKQAESDPISKQWKMDYFYVPKVTGAPDWSKIPAIPMTNMYRPVRSQQQTATSGDGDISATFRAAWDSENFYLRVEAEDDIFDPGEQRYWESPVNQETALYMLDGCLEVYFDCAANGRLGNEGFDLDDYRYDFSVGNPEGKSGPGNIYRFYEVFLEYAGGIDFPTKEEAAEKIKCEFTRISPTKYAYTIIFAQRYVAPFRLEAGSIAGFGLYLHDRMDDGEMGNKGLSLATEPGAHVDRSPRLWPLMILEE